MNIKNNVEIIRLDDEGRGIGYIDNKIIFIPNALIGEVVDVDIVKETSKYYIGEVIKYITKSAKRIQVKCPYYNLCGGCSLQHINYKDTLSYKCEKFKNILNKFASVNSDIEVIQNNNHLGYRNKIELKIKNSEWGYFNSNTHDFVSIDKCLIAKESINEVIENKKLFNIQNGSIIIRSNYNDEILIVIKSENKIVVDIERLKSVIKLVGIIENDKCIYGEKYFIEKVNEKLFKVNYNSFFQVNEYITNKMIDILKENSNGKILLDLYCGVGFLGQCINDKFEKIYGIEINKDSILDAISNANMNRIDNTYYLCGDSAKCISKIKDSIDILLIDPPRSGLVKNMINDVLNVGAKKIMYVSCNPITLARDLKSLIEFYDIQKIYLLDMFSNTYHFESVCILYKKMETV